jgi:uncharacterized cupredoxin-like copper-binding protein
MSRVLRIAVALFVGAAVATVGYTVSASGSESEALGPGVVRVEVGIEHSQFDLGDLRVEEGTLVEFIVQNDDPIDHELVVGGPEVHQRHQQGTERRHPPVPGEVSVAPGDRGMTFYEFDEPGDVAYMCHLPGHVAYGMVGTIEVVPVT